ncbi:MAG: hypothetical protein EHM36_05440, partial [Deltaproteobacteria bacterium]
MPFLLRNLTLTLAESEELLPEKLAARLSLCREDIISMSVVRKGVDARHKGRIKFVYTVEFRVAAERFRKDRVADPDLEYLEERAERQFPQLTS